MPGSAVSQQFQFSVASVLVGPMASQLSLNSAAHSIGLVKNVMVEASPSVVELTQGLQNDVVFSAVNNMPIKVSAEVFEFTAKNLAYGLSLDATTGYTPIATSNPLFASVAAAATTAVVVGDVTTTYTAGSWIFIQQGTDDAVHIAKVSSATFSSPNTTINFVGYPVPAGMTFTTGGRIGKVNRIDADPDAANQSLAVRIVGTQVGDKRPVVLHFPKARILKGFAMRFTSDNFGNLPFEFTPYVPLSTDVGYSADFTKRMNIWVP